MRYSTKLLVLEVSALISFILGRSDITLQLSETTPHIICTLTAVEWKEVEDCKFHPQELTD